MMRALCWVGWHRWDVRHVQTFRYFSTAAVLTERCERCPKERKRSVW